MTRLFIFQNNSVTNLVLLSTPSFKTKNFLPKIKDPFLIQCHRLR